MSTINKLQKQKIQIPKIPIVKLHPKPIAKPSQKPTQNLKSKPNKKPEIIKKDSNNQENKVKTKISKEINQNIDSEDNTVSINSTINEIFATSEVIQTFTNPLQKSIELTISFPLKAEIQLTKFVITIGDKTVISKVLPKEKAEEKYTDAIASGNTGFLSTLDETGKNYTINVGNILPKEKVKLISIFNQMISSQDMSYEFSFLEQYPCFIYEGNVVQSKKIIGKFILNTKSKITRLISPYMDENVKKTTNFKITFNENYTQATINFEKKMETENEKEKESINVMNKKAITNSIRRRRIMIGTYLVNNTLNNLQNSTFTKDSYPGIRNGFTPLSYFSFLFRTENMNKPMLYYQYDPEKKETAYCLNYVFTSKNIKNIPVPKIPDQDCNISYYTKYQENVMNDNPGLFIFLVDQSGSMRGNSIDLVKKALVLFMQSLPQKSYFQLIGFGTNFKKYNETPIEYNKESVKSILETIKYLQANMGGTNISSPLQDIFESKIYDNINLSRNIFLLTDGQVNNREQCINLISTNSNRFRIQAIGIGQDFDKVLIERAGKLGNGSSSFVEHINNINEVVIENLNKCLRPYLVNIKFGFANKSIMKNPIIINEPINNFTYQDEVISYAFILNDKNKIKFEDINEPIQVEMWANDPLNEIKESIKLLPNENIMKINNGDNLIKTIVGQSLKFNKELLNSEEKEISFAKKYQILSKNTALFGEILNSDTSQKTELIKVDINSQRKMPRALGSGVYRPMPNRRRMVGNAYTMNMMRPNKLLERGTNAVPQKKGIALNYVMTKSIRPTTGTLSKKTASKPLAKNVMNLLKKPSYEQKSDGTIRVVDEFNDILMAQDIIEGFWDENEETKILIKKIKGGYDKIMEYIKNKKINSDNLSKIMYTILAIYYIEKEKAKKIKEYRLVINKGKKYLLNQGFNYDEEIKKINI